MNQTESAPDQGWMPSFEPSPARWPSHPRKHMLMTPALVVFGGLFAFAVPTLVAAFFQMFFFHPDVSQDWSPMPASAIEGRTIYLANGCIYCHSGYTRPQDVRVGLYYLYSRLSLPGDFATTDSSPNTFGTARIGPDLSQEAGWHPDDWEAAHFADPRYVAPDSVMPRFNWLTDTQEADLALFLQTRSGKSGLVRYAGQLYMKRLFLAANNVPPPLKYSDALKMTLKDVALAAANAPDPPSGGYDGLDWPDPINLNHVDRSYWLVSNPLPVTKDNLMRGRMIFQQRCIGCHDRGGGAVSEPAKFLSPMPIAFTGADDAVGGNDTSPGDYYYRVLRGVNGTAMENFGTRLRVDDIWRVVLFLKTIPNGGLDPDRVPTPDMYIQWQPNPDLLGYVEKHPIDQNKEFVEFDPASNIAQALTLGVTPSPPPPGSAATALTTKDPFMLEARRCLAGLNDADSFITPGYGEVSLAAAARDIRTIYEDLLDTGWADYVARGGDPIPPASQKDALPDLTEELR
jgi:cbb3-type cytochrome c oxidase subunit II